MTNILPFKIFNSNFFLFIEVMPNITKHVRQPMGLIDNINLSHNIGHLRLHLCRVVPDLANPHKDAQLRDCRVFACKDEQAKASHSTTREEIGNILHVEISR